MKRHHRTAAGRFENGNPGGPGRPPAAPPAPAPQIGDDVDLHLAAIAQRDTNAAWEKIEATMPPADVAELARATIARGYWVPDRIAQLAHAKRKRGPRK